MTAEQSSNSEEWLSVGARFGAYLATTVGDAKAKDSAKI
jgi:hypothetical protein